MQAAGAWLPLMSLCLLLLLHTSTGQNLTQNCSQDLSNKTCSCETSEKPDCSQTCFNLTGQRIQSSNFYEENCNTSRLSAGTIVGITLGVVLLLAGVTVGTVLGICRKQRWDTPDPCSWKPSEISGSSAPPWQAHYGSRSSEQLTQATTPRVSPAPSPGSPGSLLYENVFLGSQPGAQSLNPSQSRGASPESEDLYMNYEDSSRSEHPIYGNVDSVTCSPHPPVPPHPETDDEDEYVVPGC